MISTYVTTNKAKTMPEGSATSGLDTLYTDDVDLTTYDTKARQIISTQEYHKNTSPPIPTSAIPAEIGNTMSTIKAMSTVGTTRKTETSRTTGSSGTTSTSGSSGTTSATHTISESTRAFSTGQSFRAGNHFCIVRIMIRINRTWE